VSDDLIGLNNDPFDPDNIAIEEHEAERIFTQHETAQRNFMEARRLAYAAVFVHGGSTPEQRELVRRDLKKFCRAEVSTYATDARDHAMLEGRRDTWLRIENHATKSLDELLAIYNPKEQ
jgi:hypothetical protein